MARSTSQRPFAVERTTSPLGSRSHPLYSSSIIYSVDHCPTGVSLSRVLVMYETQGVPSVYPIVVCPICLGVLRGGQYHVDDSRAT
jgi:hypothetical protein